MSETVDLRIRFDNQEALDHFTTWLSEAGEQDYWMWMECREGEEDGDITVLNFENGDFNVIKADCGRLDSR